MSQTLFCLHGPFKLPIPLLPFFFLASLVLVGARPHGCASGTGAECKVRLCYRVVFSDLFPGAPCSHCQSLRCHVAPRIGTHRCVSLYLSAPAHAAVWLRGLHFSLKLHLRYISPEKQLPRGNYRLQLQYMQTPTFTRVFSFFFFFLLFAICRNTLTNSRRPY